MKSSLRSWREKWIAGSTALLLGVIGTASTASAGTVVGNGMPAGITWGQTARLNVLSPPNAAIRCAATLQFFDGRGYLLAESAEMIDPGHLESLDLNGDEVLRDGRESRLQIYGMVRVDRRNRRACRGVVHTLEVFDNETFETRFLVIPPNPIIP